MEPKHNRSPIILQDHKLGVEAWAVKILIKYSALRLNEWRKHKTGQQSTGEEKRNLCTWSVNDKKNVVTLKLLRQLEPSHGFFTYVMNTFHNPLCKTVITNVGFNCNPDSSSSPLAHISITIWLIHIPKIRRIHSAVLNNSINSFFSLSAPYSYYLLISWLPLIYVSTINPSCGRSWYHKT